MNEQLGSPPIFHQVQSAFLILGFAKINSFSDNTGPPRSAGTWGRAGEIEGAHAIYSPWSSFAPSVKWDNQGPCSLFNSMALLHYNHSLLSTQSLFSSSRKDVFNYGNDGEDSNSVESHNETPVPLCLVALTLSLGLLILGTSAPKSRLHGETMQIKQLFPNAP